MPRAQKPAEVETTGAAEPVTQPPPAKAAPAKAPAAKTAATKTAATKTAATKTAATKTAATKTAATKTAATKAAAAKDAPARARLHAKPGATDRPVPEDKWLAKQQAALYAHRAELLASAQALQAEADAMVADAEPGDTQFDDESGEGATTAMDREMDLLLSGQQMAQVREIDIALDKIDDGVYGICEATGEPIAKARLEAIPWAAMSVKAKSGGLLGRR